MVIAIQKTFHEQSLVKTHPLSYKIYVNHLNSPNSIFILIQRYRGLRKNTAQMTEIDILQVAGPIVFPAALRFRNKP